MYLVLDPLCAVAFNIADGGMRDVTADIARELRLGARESSPEPTSSRPCRTAASSATTQAARGLKGTVRSYAGPSDEPFLVRHGIRWHERTH